MIKKKFFNIFYFSVSFVAIIIFVGVVYTWYNLILDDAKLSHQKKQLEMSQVSAIGIQMFFEHIQTELSFFYKLQLSYENYDSDELGILLDHFKTEGIIGMYLLEGENKNQSIFGTPPIASEIKNITNIHNQEFYLSDIFRENSAGGQIYFYLCKKINPGIFDNKVFYIKLNLDFILEKYLLPLQLSKSDYAWVLDDEGTLIYHPNHKKMILKNIFESSSKCNSCHQSFDIQKNMLVNKTGFSEYLIGDEPSKIMAYSPIKVANRNWFISISTYLSDVTYNLKSKLSLLIISSTIIFIIIIGFIIFNYSSNLKRIKAEEEKKIISNEMKFQDEVNHISRLASVGELVDTVAHEINTPAGIIGIQADTINLKYPDNKYSEEIAIIKKQVSRISSYTRSLLNFSKRIPYNPQRNNIITVLEDSLYLLGHRFREKQILVVKEFDLHSYDYFFDKLQLEQVFINILNNAVDEMEIGGTITLSIKTILGESENASFQSGIEIRIHNSGNQIPEQNIHQIFEAFFTTKPDGKGTGLGLSISKKIIQRHEGTIEVKNTDSGPVFIIRLPNKKI